MITGTCFIQNIYAPSSSLLQGRRTIEIEIRERGYTWGTMERKANNREEWRKLVLAICAMRHNKD
jgi:hypothetical protein